MAGSNPTVVEPGKIVVCAGSIYRVEECMRDAHGTLRSFYATRLHREPHDEDDEDDDDYRPGRKCAMEVYDEDLLLVFTIH
jgi:hypothetical protein